MVPKLRVAVLPLQELDILQILPFDRRVVQLYGSCTQGTNIQLVLEYMQVTLVCASTLGLPKCRCQLSELFHLSMLYALNQGTTHLLVSLFATCNPNVTATSA